MNLNYRDRIYAKYASHFKDSGSRFDEAAANHRAGAYEHLLRGWLPPSKDVAIVDLACGAGDLLHFLKCRGYTNVSGVDVSPEQVAISRQVVSDVRQADVLEFLPSRPGFYNLITALDIVEHLTKDEALSFLDGCVSALRPGGRLVLQTPNAESPFFNVIRYGDFTHENAFTAESLGRLMRLCGLVDVEARESGPVVRGVKSLVRCVGWQVIRLGMKAWNLVETGAPGSGVFTRVFLISGRKPAGG